MEIEGIKVHQSNINKKAPLDKKQYADCTYKPQTPPKCFYFGPYNPQMFGILPNFKLAETLMPKPTSFKGAVLKKTDFKGSDSAVIEKYKINPQQLKSKDELQDIAKEKIDELKEKDFGGRQEETKIQRKAMLKEWFDYVIKENDAYSNAQRLIILSAITKGLDDDNDTLPPVLNKRVLADTVTELEDRLKLNKKENFNFNKMYQNNLRTEYLEDSSTGETMTGWVIIPSKTNDPENFEKNVEKLKTLSHNNWCTKSFNAEPYLSQGDFHVYLENGNPKLGVRFAGDKVQEIQGEKNNGKIPHKYFDTFKEHQQEYDMKLSCHAQSEVKNAEATKIELQKVEQEFGSAVELKTIEDAVKVLNYFGIETEKTEKGLIISKYKQPSEDFTFDDYGINENKLFKHIEQIKGTANFYNSQITNLGNLQSIGGGVDFAQSNVTDIGNLKSIGGSICIGNEELRQKLVKSLEMMNGLNLSDIRKTIKEGNTEKILKVVGIKTQKDKDGLLIISEYKQPFGILKFADLGLDENELFKDIKEIQGNAYFRNSKVTNLGNLQSIGGDADFIDSQITNLGDLQSIGGYAYFQRSKLINLGKLQSIGGGADFRDSQITDLGDLQSIGGNAYFSGSQITDLGDLQSIGGNACFQRSKLINLAKLQSIGGKADFIGSQITNLGDLQSIGGYADFRDSQITDLGDLQLIGGGADFTNSKVTNLGNLQSIGGGVDFAQSNVTDLGNLKSIGGRIRIGNEELRQKLVKSLEMMNGLNLSDIRKTIKEGNTEKILNVVGIKTQKDKDGLLIISEYKQPSGILKFADLGLDENELFKDIKEIQGNADFENSQVTNLGNLQSIGGGADFRDSQVTNLGNLQSIGGDADFRDSQITDLGDLQLIGGGADFRDSQITDLGDLQLIGGGADFSDSQITNLGNLQSIGGHADFSKSKVTNLGNLQSIGGDADFLYSKVTNLGNLQSIGMNAYFENSKVTDLGNLQSIGGDADFVGSQITNLGDLQSIGGNAYFQCSKLINLGKLQSIGGGAKFSDSQITDLGQLQSIGGDVYMGQSKLSVNDFENVTTKKIYQY